jgi:UDP-N-acetyl-D-glucosamine/UDP-N-acetyl-D-galactosamine dehydrogenase
MSIYEKLLSKEAKISIIGLGYVGLPIALEFARKFSVIGFDIRKDRVQMMKNSIDPSEELSSSAFEGCDILFTADAADLKKADFHIIAVPTPIDEHNLPDLKPLLAATKTVGEQMKAGDYVVYESTVYPGCTEEDCVPLLESLSGLKNMKDFKTGFSPERINPGDREHTLTRILKVVSGCDDESLDVIAKVYGLIIKAGIHKAPTIKVAEAAKIIENTQRDVNIGLMNELSIIFNRMNINTYDVLEAAGTKWNFLKFSPGLVGGHCIGVDPYYLSFKAKEYRYHPQIINSGRFVNDSMGFYVAKQLVKKMISMKKQVLDANVLIMGSTFKENVSDIRNSKVIDIVSELISYGVKVTITDPFADPDDFKHEYGHELTSIDDVVKMGEFDGIIVAVSHKNYVDLRPDYFINLSTADPILFDLKGIYRKAITSDKKNKIVYWTL